MSFVQVTQRAKGKENVQENAELLFVMASLLNNEWFRLSKRVEDNADLFLVIVSSSLSTADSSDSRWKLRNEELHPAFLFLFFLRKKKRLFERGKLVERSRCAYGTPGPSIFRRGIGCSSSHNLQTLRETRHAISKDDSIRSDRRLLIAHENQICWKVWKLKKKQ